MNKRNKKFNNNIERIFLLVSIVLFIIMLALTIFNFVFFASLVNIFAIVLFAICNIMMKDKSMKLYVDILYVLGLMLVSFSAIYTIISLID